MAANIETGERQSAGADDSVSEQLRVAFKDFYAPNPQPKPAGPLHEVLAAIGRHLNNESSGDKDN
jgi:hypothetical protein